MSRQTWVAVALTAACVIIAHGPAVAHPGHAHSIMGTIAAAQAGQVEVLDKANVKTVIAITGDTKILVGQAAGAPKDLVVGSRVVVEAKEEEGKKFVALKIQLPARAAK